MTDSQPQFELPPQPVLGFLNPLLVSFGVTCLGYGMLFDSDVLRRIQIPQGVF